MRSTGPLILAALLAGCAQPTDFDPYLAIDLALQDLPSNDEVIYVLWAELGGEPTLLGSFRGGGMASSDFRFRRLRADPSIDMNEATGFFVTLQDPADPVSDGAEAPRLLEGGAPQDGEASLAFPGELDLDAFTGSYVLMSPTDDSIDDQNHEAGIWFLNRQLNGDLLVGLNIPLAPAGWVWEGWVRTQGEVMSLGRFVDPSREDNSCTSCGSDPGPGFPGGDLITNLPSSVLPPVDLADGETSISVSIEPGNLEDDPTGADIFELPLIFSSIASGAPLQSTIAMERNSILLPTGTVTWNYVTETDQSGTNPWPNGPPSD